MNSDYTSAYDDSGDASQLPSINIRFLLVINIPLYRDADSRIYADPLWFKDLVEHLRYIEVLTIACPLMQGMPVDPVVPLDSDPRFSRVQFINLPAPTSRAMALLFLPLTISKLWRAARRAEVIQSGIAGWPLPLGWIVAPMAKVLGKFSLMIVESAPWRHQVGLPTNTKTKIIAAVYERLGRWCLSNADLIIFTQDEYRQSMLRRARERGHVIHASWIDEGVIVSDEQARKIWQEKSFQSCGEIRILFAGRLEVEKGVLVLLEAVKRVADKNIPLRLDILGSGSLVNKCHAVSDELKQLTHVKVLGTVAYGAPLFELLQQYHAIVLPSISDEQPRIVYDAYSQSVPALASSTAGLRDCIVEGQTGWLVAPNNATALSALLQQASQRPNELQAMGMNALAVARKMTHQRMHRVRQRLLVRLVNKPIA